MCIRDSLSIKCSFVLWAQYTASESWYRVYLCGWCDWVHACGGALFKVCFGERLLNIALPLRPLHKVGLHFPRLSAQLAKVFYSVFSPCQNCHLKNECIIVLNREIWSWRWYSGNIMYSVVLWLYSSFRSPLKSSLPRSCSVTHRIHGCLLSKASWLLRQTF